MSVGVDAVTYIAQFRDLAWNYAIAARIAAPSKDG